LATGSNGNKEEVVRTYLKRGGGRAAFLRVSELKQDRPGAQSTFIGGVGLETKGGSNRQEYSVCKKRPGKEKLSE